MKRRRLVMILLLAGVTLAGAALTHKVLFPSAAGFLMERPSQARMGKPAVPQFGWSQPTALPASDQQQTPERQDQKKSSTESGRLDPTELTALVTAERTAIRAPLSVHLLGLHVRVGQAVSANEPLLCLDGAETELELARQQARVRSAQRQLEQARADLDRAQDQHRRNRYLLNHQAVSQESLTACGLEVQAQTARLAALAEAVQAEQRHAEALAHRLAKYHVVAPLDGTVADVIRRPGTFVQQGEVLLYLLSQEKHLKVRLPAAVVHELENLEFAFFLDSRWHHSPAARVHTALNPDGSRTALLRLPADLNLLVGQTIKLQVMRKEAATP